jgi:outer membrane protein TolC
MRYLLSLFFLLFAVNLAAAIEEPLSIDPSVDPYLIEGLAQSSRITTARYQGVQAQAGIGASGALPDPKLALVFNNYPIDSFAGDETPMTGKIIKLSQAFPYPGKLAAKEAVAEARSAAMQARLFEEGLLLRRDLVQVWNDLLFKREMVVTVEKKLKALEDFQRFIEERYAVGQSGQQDVLNIQVSRTEAMNALSTAKRQAKGALYEFNRLLNRPSEAPVETVASLTPYPTDSFADDPAAGIESLRPMFRLYRSRIDESQQRVKLAELQGRPDFGIGAGYTYREESRAYDSTDFATLEIGITLPFVNRSRVNSERAQADAALQAARSDYRNLLNNEQMRVYDLQQQLLQLRERIALYREGIVVQTRQSYEASLSAYQVGRYELSSLLNNLLAVYSAEIESLRSVADFNKTVAEFRYRAGTGSEQIQSLLNSNPNDLVKVQ